MWFEVVVHADENKLIQVTERFSALVESSGLRKPVELSVTISIGAAEAREDEEVDDLVKRADEKLYRAKTGGRNQIQA
jgi:two-component system cell cycle response regulator